MLLISVFHLGQPVDDDVFCSFRTIFTFPDCFPVPAVRTAHGSYRFLLSQDVFSFFQTIFHHFGQQVAITVHCFLTYQWYLRMSSVSRYPAGLQRCQLRFSRMLLVCGLCSQAHSTQAGRHFLWQYYSRHLPLSNFSLLTRSPFWLLTSPPHSEQEEEAKHILLELLYLTDMSCEQYPSFRLWCGKHRGVAHLSLYFVRPCSLQSNSF